MGLAKGGRENVRASGDRWETVWDSSPTAVLSNLLYLRTGYGVYGGVRGVRGVRGGLVGTAPCSSHQVEWAK